MDPELERLLNTVWDIEQARTAGLYQQREQSELGKASARGLGTSNIAIAMVADAYLALLDEKAANLIEGVRRTLAAHSVVPPAALRASLIQRYNNVLAEASSHAQGQLVGLNQRMQIKVVFDPLTEKATALRQRCQHEFEIMLAELSAAARNAEAVTNNTSISVTGSQGVQIGDHNVQHNQVVVLRDLLLKIDQSNASPAEKAEAKGKLKAFLEHPLVAAAAGGLIGSLGPILQ